MKKKVCMILVATMIAASTTGCGTQKEITEEKTTVATTTQEVTDATTTQSTDETVAGKTFESEYGYSVVYDDTIFDTINDEGTDYFELKNQDVEKDVPVCVGVTKTEDTVDNLVDGLKLQSGKDDVTAEDTTMGKNEYASKVVSYQTEEERGTVYETFHVVDVNGTVYLIEIANGDDLADEVANAIEELLASFEVSGSTEEDTSAEAIDYSVFTNLDSQTVQEFATNVQKKVADKDWTGLAEDVSYPITVGSEKFDSAEQFAAYDFSDLFTEDFYQAVADTDCSSLFANADGAMLGDGQIWFAELLDDNGDSKGLKIITINE